MFFYSLFRDSKIKFFLILIPIFFYFDKILLNELARLRFWDVLNFSYPFYYDYGETFKNYGIFFWYQNISGGVPSFASQFSPIYPLNFFSLLMPPWALYIFILVSLGIISISGMYLLSKHILRFEKDIAIICSISFFLTISATKHIQEEFFMAYAFPLFVYLLFSMEVSKINKLILKTLIILIFFLFSPPVMHGPYYLVATLLMVPLIKKINIKIFFVIILVWFCYAIIHFPQLYALYEYIPYINRNWSFPNWSNLSGISSNIFSYVYLSNLFFFIFPSIFFILFKTDNKYQKINLVIFLSVLTLVFIFRSPLMSIFESTFFEKVDLRQIYSIIFFFINIFIFTFLNFINKNLENLKILSSSLIIITLVMFMIIYSNRVYFDTSFLKIELIKNFIFSFGLIFYLFFKKYSKKVFLFGAIISLLIVTLLVKILTLAEDSVTWKMFGDLNFISKNIDSKNFNRVATIGIPNAVTRYLNIESYGGQNAFFPTNFKEQNLLAIENELNKFNSDEIKITKEYTYALNLTLPYLVNKKDYRPFWDDIENSFLIDFDKLIEMGVTHIISNGKIDELEKISLEIKETNYENYINNLNYSENIIKKFFQKLENSKRYSKLIIYKISDDNNRIYIKDNLNNKVKPKNILKIKDGIKILIENENHSKLIIKNNYHKNWIAKDYDKDLLIKKSENGFQEIDLEPGAHKITLIYKDKILELIFYVSLFIGIIFLFYSLYLFGKFNKNEHV